MRRSALRLGSALLGLVVAAHGTSRAGEPVSEVDLVRSALEQGALRAGLEAGRARAEAAAVAGPLLDNPVIEGRREQEGGPEGATTDYLGGRIVLGLGGLAGAQAARLRGRAADAWHRAAVVEAVCEARRGVLDQWLAAERVEVVGAAQARLDAIMAGQQALADVGEVAGYDRARLQLAADAHRHARDAATVEARARSAALEALAGVPVGRLALVAPAPLAAGPEAAEAALAADPVLRALRDERQAAERALVAARRAGAPELELAAGARLLALPDDTERSTGFELGAGLALPLFDRNQVEVGERGAALAELDAALARREAMVRAAVAAAGQLAGDLGPEPSPPPSAVVWDGARARYGAGEASIDELLAVAADIEAAELAALEAVVLRREARLALSCTVGTFPEPELQALLEEHTR